MPNGQWAVLQKGDTIFLSGQGASPAGDRPFLDSFDLRTGKSRRLFRSAKDAYENFLAFANNKHRRAAHLAPDSDRNRPT